MMILRRVAGALRDRTGMDIAIENLPAFLPVVRWSAAGEGAHASLKRNQKERAIAQNLGLDAP